MSKDKQKLCKHAALKKFTKVSQKVTASKPKHETGMENPSIATITIIVGVVCAWSLVLPFELLFLASDRRATKTTGGKQKLDFPNPML